MNVNGVMIEVFDARCRKDLIVNNVVVGIDLHQEFRSSIGFNNHFIAFFVAR